MATYRTITIFLEPLPEGYFYHGLDELLALLEKWGGPIKAKRLAAI